MKAENFAIFRKMTSSGHSSLGTVKEKRTALLRVVTNITKSFTMSRHRHLDQHKQPTSCHFKCIKNILNPEKHT